MFYDPSLEAAGRLAQEYGVTLSDVMSLLALAGRDEALVRQSLDESVSSEDAKAAKNADRPFDVVEKARVLLVDLLTERST